MIKNTFFSQDANKSSMMICTEMFKGIVCFIIYRLQSPLESCKMRWRFKESFQTSAFPALLFAIQNYLNQIACQRVDPVIFTLLNQTKTLFTALCLFILLGRRQSFMQVVSLFLLMAAAIVLQTKSGSFELRAESIFNLGLVTMIGSTFISGLTAAISQGILQEGKRNSYLYSCEISGYSLLWIVVSILLGSKDGYQIFEKGFFFGWGSYTWAPVLNYALGGILVGQVTKYAGSVEKGFALVGGILVSALLQFVLYSIPLTSSHWTAFVLVALSIWMHTNFPSVHLEENGKLSHEKKRL